MTFMPESDLTQHSRSAAWRSACRRSRHARVSMVSICRDMESVQPPCQHLGPTRGKACPMGRVRHVPPPTNVRVTSSGMEIGSGISDPIGTAKSAYRTPGSGTV